MSAPGKVAGQPAQTNQSFPSRCIKGGAACTLTALAATALALGILLYLRTRSEALRSVGSISTMRQLSAGLLTGLGGLTLSLSLIWILSKAVKASLCQPRVSKEPKKVQVKENPESSANEASEDHESEDVGAAPVQPASDKSEKGGLAIPFSYKRDLTGWPKQTPESNEGTITYDVDWTVDEFKRSIVQSFVRGTEVLQITCTDAKGKQKVLDFGKLSPESKVKEYFESQFTLPIKFTVQDKSLLEKGAK